MSPITPLLESTIFIGNSFIPHCSLWLRISAIIPSMVKLAHDFGTPTFEIFTVVLLPSTKSTSLLNIWPPFLLFCSRELASFEVWWPLALSSSFTVLLPKSSLPMQPFSWKLLLEEIDLGCFIVREGVKKMVRFRRSLPILFIQPSTHPRIFVKFDYLIITKGEIRVEKGDFRRYFGVWGVWTLFGNQPPHPPTFGKDLQKNTFFFGRPP